MVKHGSTVQVVKSVKQNYSPTLELLELLEDFRLMVNDCIRIGLKENISSMKTLSLKCYHALSQYDIATCYRLTAISKVAGILRNYRKALRKNLNTKKPYADKLMLTDCYGFKIQGRRLRLTLRAHEYVYIDLNPHTLSVISGYTVRSITMTTCTIVLAFSKEIDMVELNGLMGIDRNLDNVTVASSDGTVQSFNLSGATQIKSKYREVKSHVNRNDVRIRKQVFGKYGKLQVNHVQPILHNASASIVKQAKEKRFGIVMEKLTGLRKLYRKGNGQGANYRSKLNSWSYYELQRQIEYKAKWEGLTVTYIPPQKTSSTCATCGFKITECAERKVYCPRCGTLEDRDVNAAKNLAKGGLRFRPDGFTGEAVKRNEMTTTPILRADANQSRSEAVA